jgi:diguanylate cyclase (GGDEF)-like protein
LDLDDFRLVNYSLGHEAGDSLLVGVFERISSCLRPEDTAAYLKGDEFAVLLEDTTRERATRVAGRFAEALQEPFVLDDREVFVTASVGIALGGGPARRHPMDLLSNAELAMYQAKEYGKARYELFEEAMNARVLRHFDVRNELRRAVSMEEFTLHYQPKIELVSGRATMMEALVRWEPPERGLVFPEEFLPVAEETGLIVAIGRWVLGEACRQAKRWQEHFPSVPPIAVCVNISPRQLNHPEFVKDVASALEGSGLEPGNLNLEITEAVAVDEAPLVVDAFGKLKALGVRFAIDDFGTGHSSLSYLNRFPVDFLKLDRSFLKGLGGDTRPWELVKGIISFARFLGLKVVAEGVETREQFERLRRFGCDFGQGYFFCEPRPSEAATAYLANHL